MILSSVPPCQEPEESGWVARQASRSALWCFAFGVKRDPLMSRHCHSSEFHPRKFRGGPSRGFWILSNPMTRFVFSSKFSFPIKNTVWDFDTGKQIMDLLGRGPDYCLHLHIWVNRRLQIIISLWGGEERSCHQKPVCRFYLRPVDIVTSNRLLGAAMQIHNWPRMIAHSWL